MHSEILCRNNVFPDWRVPEVSMALWGAGFVWVLHCLSSALPLLQELSHLSHSSNKQPQLMCPSPSRVTRSCWCPLSPGAVPLVLLSGPSVKPPEALLEDEARMKRSSRTMQTGRAQSRGGLSKGAWQIHRLTFCRDFSLLLLKSCDYLGKGSPDPPSLCLRVAEGAGKRAQPG